MIHLVIYTAPRTIAYIVGIGLIFFGVTDFRVALTSNTPSFNPFAGFVMDVTFFISGVLTCVWTRFRYGGGFWSIIGAFLVAGAFAGTVSMIETILRGEHYNSTVALYIRIAACWLVGIVFLFIGHRRHCKKKWALTKTALDLL